MDQVKYEESFSSFQEEDEHNQLHEKAKEAEEERKNLARKEESVVKLLRIVVFLVLLVTTLGVSLAVFFYSRDDQVDDFESHYTANAFKITESFRYAFGNTFEALGALSATITSQALSTGSKFPNVTVPDFEVHGMKARILSGATFAFWLPFVTDETRLGWESYTNTSHMWFEKALMSEVGLRKRQDIAFGLADEGQRMLQEQPQQQQAQRTPFTTAIHDVEGNPKPYNSTGPWLPIWQMSPILPDKGRFLNMDYLSRQLTRPLMLKVLQSSKVVLGPISDIFSNQQETNADTAAIMNVFLMLNQYRHKKVQFMKDAMSPGGYPVFDNFSPDRKIVGVVYFNIYWRMLFADILPEGANGYHFVIETTLNQTFTYQLDGPNITYLGAADFHEPEYDHLMVSEDMIHALNTFVKSETTSYTSVPVAEDFVGYTVRVYPSSVTESAFVNNAPIMFTSTIVAVFIFTSLVFITYDWYVGKRQEVVMARAVASSAIVSSLFPSNVRDKLYEENEAQQVHRENTPITGLPNAPNHSSTSRPIADVFDDTTIYFADLAGFTAWSSKRTPVEVFDLLETLYGAFDQIAMRRRVYKIETIGDCYVAVTGLPDTQEDHAERMVKFARDCMLKMSQLVIDLSEKLGEDTAQLEMRVGLHSGSVTAGVLRGAKGRFQLFGDTVNTASRMESNGVKGRIHVSQATADALIARGKESWLLAREEKVIAKGKGEMQTYFVDTRSEKSIVSRTNSMASGSNGSNDCIQGLNLIDELASIEFKLKTRLENRALKE